MADALNKKLIDQVKDLFNQNKFQECIDLIKQTLLISGISIRCLPYLGAAYANLHQYELAIAAFSQYLHYIPDNAEVLSNFGATIYQLQNNALAEKILTKGYAIAPNHAMVNRNLGIFYYENAQLEKALFHYENVIQLDNSDINHLSYAHALLSNNNFEKGWQEYEYRISSLETLSQYEFTAPCWQGENLNGKTICIYIEQGVGDCIQFIRFLSLLKQRYEVKIYLVCAVPLARLFQCVSAIDVIFCELKTIQPYDYYLLICSLPLRLQIYHQAQLMPEPYLQIHPAINFEWKQKISNTDKIKIGICWSGNPAFQNNKRRSCQLSDFLYLRQYPEVELFSLQKNITPKEEELLTIAGITNLGPSFNDFADTGAVINNMDLIISVDTALVHLAGALGATTWTLLSYYNEWRYPSWLKTTPWYDSVTCIRQSQPGDWRSVFKQVNEKLASFIALHQSK